MKTIQFTVTFFTFLLLAFSGYAQPGFGGSNLMTGTAPSSLGDNNFVNGNYSLAAGDANSVTGVAAFALGGNNAVTGDAAFAMGAFNQSNSNLSFTAGLGNIADALGSFALGQTTQIGAAGLGSFVLGSGPNVASYLVNNIPNSLKIGFKSNVSTLFVGPSPTPSTPGFVGIGTDNPQFRLDVDDHIGLSGNLIAHRDNGPFNIYSNLGDTDGPYIRMYGNNHGHQGRISIVSHGEKGGTQFYHRDPATGIYTFGMVIERGGKVGIGTETPERELDVAGIIRACEVQVNRHWCDYVFEENYELMPLEQLETYVKTEKHLPKIEPASVIEKNGLNMGDMQVQQMEKIEELTLYIIQLNKDLQEVRSELQSIKATK